MIDDSKVSDHHAIIPTAGIGGVDLSSLPAGERRILTLLMVRLLCAVGDQCHIKETVVALECEGISFCTKGKQVMYMGWKAIQKAYLDTLKSAPADDAPVQELPALNEHMTFLPVRASIREGKTIPPKSYTEDTLLRAMETAGAEVLTDDVERKGLGTPATRAGIIEKLVKVGFVERRGAKKNIALLPTEKGASLITILPEELQSPALTAEWEQKLKRVERSEMEADAFMSEVTEMVRDLVADNHPIAHGSVLFSDNRNSVGTCPRCGNIVIENKKGFACVNRNCRFALWRDNHFFSTKRKELTATIAASLLKEGRALVKGLYSEKTGRTYDATVLLEDTGDKYVNFKLEF